MRPAAETLLELLRCYRCENDETIEQLAEAFIDALLDEVSAELVELKILRSEHRSQNPGDDSSANDPAH